MHVRSKGLVIVALAVLLAPISLAQAKPSTIPDHETALTASRMAETPSCEAGFAPIAGVCRQMLAKSSCPPGTKPVPETDNCVPVSNANKKPQNGCGQGMFKVEGRCVPNQDAASACGPGFHLEGHRCVKGGKAPPPQATLPTWQVEGLKHGCKKGMAWNAQEGCHEND